MKKLLIVEDEKLIRQGIKTMIMRSQIPVGEIIECKNGLEALGVIKSQSIDVMITDIRMPKMDGITLVKEIKTLSYVPKVIVISGYDDFSYAVELLRNGAREYLLKPVEREKLIEALEKINKEVEDLQLTEERERDKRNKLAYKQLKFFLLGESEEYLDELESNIADNLEENGYIIYCAAYKKRKKIDNERIIYLEDVSGQDIFITGLDSKNEVSKEVLADDCFGSSKKKYTVKELKEAYREAVLSRKRAFFKGKSEIEKLECDEHVEEKAFNEKEMTERITQMIGTERFEEAMKLLEELQYKIEQEEISIKQTERTIEQLLQQLQETYKRVIDLNEETFLLLNNKYQFETVQEYFKVLKAYLKNVHEKIINQFEDYKNKQKIKKSIEYIKENYNKDLNMAVVSNYISMNYSLFSLAFKQYTGMNFVNYLKEIRVNEAKKLLVETDKKIIEISVMVGYENEKYFMKTFKSIYGVSPSEYRKNMQIGEI